MNKTINSTTSNPRRRLTLTIIGIAVALASIFIAAAPAGAAIQSGSLTIYKDSSKYCYYAYGTFPMNRQTAQFLIADGAFVEARMWGEDPSYDDLQIGPLRGTGATASPNIHDTYYGIEVVWQRCGVSGSTLNEDWGGDELYAGFNLFNPSGVWLDSFETNRVYGSY